MDLLTEEATMKKCFVIQPFDDGGKYDKRYESVFAPAIKAARLEPYRVDRDPSVSIPIVDIENGIRSADICFAEITTDNPNVWFELGFAFAVPRDVIMASSEERKTKYPFDVQHRNIIKYNTAAPQDFDDLGKRITEHLLAVMKKKEEIGRAVSLSPVKDTEGLTQHELVALVTVMQNSFLTGGYAPAYRIKEDMNAAGFTDIAVSISIKTLTEKGMVQVDTQYDDEGMPYKVYNTSDKGERWLTDNQDKLVLKAKPKATDDIPF
jgi:nucleoside 2-deoxyribosyltransferase